MALKERGRIAVNVSKTYDKENPAEHMILTLKLQVCLLISYERASDYFEETMQEIIIAQLCA
jgi:hypothetical protein